MTSSFSSAGDQSKDLSAKSEKDPRKSSHTLWSLSPDEHVSDSMSVTSADQEKLLLLNKNTELRRVNKELAKANEEWDHVYHNGMAGLRRRLEASELEKGALKELNGKLLLKVENQQSARDYYEQAFMLELKKNQELQEYVRLLEPPKDRVLSFSFSSGADVKQQSKSHQEVLDLKEQLQALRCQTQIYEAEFQTEHNKHKHTLRDNQRLRRKREEMSQQVELLQEQLKIYEDDFRRERSDKQMLQRLLLKKSHSSKDPVLVHRCNEESQPQGGDKRPQTSAIAQHHPLCPKHQNWAKD